MTLSARDKKLLALWVAMVALGAGYWFFWPEDAAIPVPTTASVESVEMAEQRLTRLRDIAATLAAKEAVLKQVSGELAAREEGLIRAATVQQAQAQMISILRELMTLEGLEIRSMDMPAVEAFGEGYGLAPVRVQFECRMEKLVNLLAGLAARRELLATRDFQILASNPKEKTVRVVLTVVGAVPKELAPNTSKK